MENINAHILCLSEHHMEEHGLLHLISSGYTLGSSFSRKNLQSGGVCIFVRKYLNIKKNRYITYLQRKGFGNLCC